MTIEDIKDRPEGQTFDCKSVKIEPKALAVPIVAMANADGGMLAIGISDIFTVNGQDCIVNFTVNGRIFTVNFTVNRKVFTVNMVSMTKRVLWNVLKNPKVSTEALAEEFSCTSRTIKNHLASLKKLGVLKREGSDKNGSWVLAIDSMWKKE